MNRRALKISAIFFAYLASYGICRVVYQTREDEYITQYNENSLISLLAHFIHTPLIHLDTAITGRRITVGKWRSTPSPEMIERSRQRQIEAQQKEEQNEK
jgi:hypothetical protein